MGLLQDKVVIITGASSGIGRAAALLFSAEGAAVVLNARGNRRWKTWRRVFVIWVERRGR